MRPPPPRSTLFPYTTLFRSELGERPGCHRPQVEVERRLGGDRVDRRAAADDAGVERRAGRRRDVEIRSEEHTSELQSQSNLVCRLLLEKKNTTTPKYLRCEP